MSVIVPEKIRNQDSIIKSLADTDLYKFTMAQVVLHRFPKAFVKFKFKCRSDWDLSKYVDEINLELDNLCTLRFTPEELGYFRSEIPFFSSDFVDYLGMIQLKREQIKCYVDEAGELQIIAEGPWRDVIWFEVPVLAIVQEVYTRTEYPNMDFSAARASLQDKIDLGNAYFKRLRMVINDFGTRRRFSRDWHDEVVATLSKQLDRTMFTGTSNVLLAMKYGIKPIGTMAHEYLQAGQGLGEVPLVKSVSYMLQQWVEEYRGDLGIALSDVVGFDAFLRDFDKYFAKLYDGCRHDSGDPFEWCERLIEHYTKLGIPAATKTAVFSDGLDFPLAFRLAEQFRGRIMTSFGIGTNLTNDVGVKPLQIVMKMVECNGNPVAKISDSKGKGMCEDAEFLNYLKRVYKIKD